MPAMSHQVFLRYYSSDKAVAEKLCEHLEKCGIPVWMAPRNISSSMGWNEQIINAVDAAKVVILIYSGQKAIPPQIERELSLAQKNGAAIFVVSLADVAPTAELQPFVKDANWLSAWNPPFASNLNNIARAIKSTLKTGSEQSPPTLDSQARPTSRSENIAPSEESAVSTPVSATENYASLRFDAAVRDTHATDSLLYGVEVLPPQPEIEAMRAAPGKNGAASENVWLTRILGTLFGFGMLFGLFLLLQAFHIIGPSAPKKASGAMEAPAKSPPKAAAAKAVQHP
jgi:hypothetical protein